MKKYNPDLIYQVVRAKLLNKKRPIASTKDRAEVSGGGRKPWPQKGTGRARAGSIRSPLFRGGGVTFGPRRDRNYKKRIPSKMRTLALALALEAKKKDNEVKEVKEVFFKEPKTSLFAKWLKEIAGDRSALVVSHKNLFLVKRIGRNIPNVLVREPQNVDVLDLVRYKYLVITEEGLRKLEERAKTISSKLKVQSAKLQSKVQS